MKSIINNKYLTATINHHGAELCSLKNTEGIEFIWQADKTIWGRHAPVLFPIVGKLRDDLYTYANNKYSMPQHGFARDKMFELVSENNTGNSEIIFSLKADHETLGKYPFNFELIISYQLLENQLLTTYKVLNNDSSSMPFSIGAHPGFCCPISSDEKFEDYKIQFSEKEKLEVALLNSGLFSGEKFLLNEQADEIKLDEKTFIKDALVFENLKSDYVTLRSTKTNHFVKMGIKGFPYFAIWSKPGAAFVCLEPWFGKADHSDHEGNILKKKGINILEPEQSFTCSFEMEVL